MKLGFVVDPLDGLKPYKDSSVAMMREAARRGHEVQAFEAREMFVRDGSILAATRVLRVFDDDAHWYEAGPDHEVPVAHFGAVLMRKDPPFDQEYYYATLLLERAEAEGTRVVNRPRALRDWNEKLSILRFPAFAPPTLVTSDAERVQSFIEAHGDVIVKKRHDDPNRNVIVETITAMGERTIMAQRYVPEIADGDKRVLVIDGKPFPHCLARIPKAGETRGNLAAGGRGIARALTARDREIGTVVGKSLAAEGIVFAGLDVIGDWLTEINVTSPTCIVEIAEQTGENAAIALIDSLERAPRPGPSGG